MSYDKCNKCGGCLPPPEFPTWDDVWKEHQSRGKAVVSLLAQVKRLQAELWAWQELKVLNPISLIDAPIMRAKREVDSHNDLGAQP